MGLHGDLLVCQQIMYLDNLEFGDSRTKQYILPRIVDFRYDVLKTMIDLDTDQDATDPEMKYGKCEVSDCCYTKSNC